MAGAALADTSWYQPYADAFCAVPLIGKRPTDSLDREILRWVNPFDLARALGPSTTDSFLDHSRWRTGLPDPSRPLPEGYMDSLLKSPMTAKTWNDLGAQWHCPVCRRNRHDTIYVAEDGRLKFLPRPGYDQGAWRKVLTICNHCEMTLLQLATEVKSRVERNWMRASDLVSPAELGAIIVARRHASHEIRHREAAQLVDIAVQRRKAHAAMKNGGAIAGLQ